jgi:subtilisin family serine protease
VCSVAIALAVAPTALTATASPLVKVDQRVLQQARAHGSSSFWIVMGAKSNLTAALSMKDWDARGAYVMHRLMATARASQRQVRALLSARGVPFQTYWSSNVILVKRGTASDIAAVAARPEVAKVSPRWRGHLVGGLPGVAVAKVDAVEWGIANIKADQVWSTYDDFGAGIVVSSIDTGTQYDHPALVKQYRGNLGGGQFNHNYNWFDPGHTCNPVRPCDLNEHGTHTMGTMVGDDGGANKIGVAPQAKWIEAAGCAGACSDQMLLDSGQWLLAPKNLNGNKPRPDLRPDVVNNSWGIPGDDMSDWYQATVDAWIASGIFPAWAAGNEGPSCSSLREPGAYPESYTMGAFDINNNIASFSSRGPSPFGGQSTTKPNIAAPGVNVRSSIPTNSYGSLSGTSMATPHVAGTVALIWSGAPALRGDIHATEKALSSTAHPVKNLTCGGTKNFNDVWGHGRLDALRAVTKAIGLEATIEH